MFFFKKASAFETWQSEVDKINLDFEKAYVKDYSPQAFLYVQCQRILEKVQHDVPSQYYEYISLDLIAQDFYNAFRDTLVFKNGFLFVTKKYLENYSKFLATEAKASDI